MVTEMTEHKVKKMTDAIFFYVASTDNDSFEPPNHINSDDQLQDYAERIIAHIASKYDVNKDEASNKVDRIIRSFLL